MGRHSSGNRAAFGGYLSVIGLIVMFSFSGWGRVGGAVMIIGGILSIILAFYRPK